MWNLEVYFVLKMYFTNYVELYRNSKWMRRSLCCRKSTVHLSHSWQCLIQKERRRRNISVQLSNILISKARSSSLGRCWDLSLWLNNSQSRGQIVRQTYLNSPLTKRSWHVCKHSYHPLPSLINRIKRSCVVNYELHSHYSLQEWENVS